MPMRIRPLESSMLYALRRAPTVETSASGEFEPSTVRKIGSSPPVARKRARTSAGVIVQAEDATWQEAQDLPLVPKLRKNGFERSSGLASSVIVRSTPDGFGVSSTACWPLASGAEATDRTRASVAPAKDPV